MTCLYFGIATCQTPAGLTSRTIFAISSATGAVVGMPVKWILSQETGPTTSVNSRITNALGGTKRFRSGKQRLADPVRVKRNLAAVASPNPQEGRFASSLSDTLVIPSW